MAIGDSSLPPLLPVAGVRWGTASAGIKKPGRRDVAVMAMEAGSRTAAVFTRNAFCAAPVIVAREHLASGMPSHLLINTGNANAGTGPSGLSDAKACCDALAAEAECEPRSVLPFSTGVIGEPLPVAKITGALPQALHALSETGWSDAAAGILTTDTVPKGACRQLEVGDRTVTVTGIAKGAGMIRPDMATMLAFVATDAELDAALLHAILAKAVGLSFNRITVDGDTSTNDACVLVATGQSGVSPVPGSDAFRRFEEAVVSVCQELAQRIVRDGEGATKFITVEVLGGTSTQECEQVAYTVAHSPLVKTAFFASDPNWGRILAAVGRAGIPDLVLEKVTIHLGDVCIVRGGGRAPDYSEESGQRVMAEEEITVRVDLARGGAQATVWTCDFSYDYVRINAEYRT